MSKKKITFLIIGLATIAIGGVLFYQEYFKKSSEKKTAQQTQEKNYYEIDDELAGVSFKIGKKFERLPSQKLHVENPSFIYGFMAVDDKNVNCYISQTKRENQGVVKVMDLRDGVFEQVKKVYTDVKLDEAEVVEVGENNNKGAKLKMSYINGNVHYIQWEVAGISQKMATFAFCEAPKAVLDLYRDDLELFLNSVRIYPVK